LVRIRHCTCNGGGSMDRQGVNCMRAVLVPMLASVLVLGLSIDLCASASAATVHRLRARPHALVEREPGAPVPSAAAGSGRFAVPGWSDQSTRRWLDNASALVGVGG
jgi:hypothetical protein